MSLVLLVAAILSSAAASQDCHATAFIGIAYRDRSGTDYSVKAEIAAFADGYASPATGELVRAGDGFADMGCSLPWKRPESGPWIALVRRGGCSIELKITNAVHQGANGLIIYNNRDSLSLQNLRVTREYQSLISIVFTYKWKGEELATILDFGTRIVAELSVANPCVAINHDHERNMQLVSISFLCFIVLTISLAWMIFYYVQRHRDLLAKERKARGYSEAEEKALKDIPTKTLKPNDKLLKDENECCPICIDPYRASEVVRTLVCSHEFHKDCIDPWLLENRTCPMCKKDILHHYGSVFLGSQESIIQVVADEAQRLAGPSSPAIQVVVVANRRTPTPSPMPSPTRLQMTSPHPDMDILTEKVQPTNRDAVCFAQSCSSLLTIDSAHEALHLIDSAQDISKTAIMSFNASNEASKHNQNTSQCPQKSQSPPGTSKSSLENSEDPQTSKTTLKGAPSSSTAYHTSKSPQKNSNPPQENSNLKHSLLDSCQELHETEDESTYSNESQPMHVNDNPLTANDEETRDGLLEKSSSETKLTESDNIS